MKLKQIKNREDLPKVFDIDKYKETYYFDIVDWVINLEFRCLSVYMQEWNDHKDQCFRSDYVFTNPILTSENFENTSGLRKYVDMRSVLDFQSQDFYWHGREIADSKRYQKYMEGFHELVEDHTNYAENVRRSPDLIARMESPYYQMLEACGVSHDGDVLVRVDLHNSEEKLMADFKSWLRSTREKMELVTPNKIFKKEDFRNWSESAILPYLDLTFWAKTNGLEITQQLLGTSLFPDEYNVNLAERIRKVVAPMARSMAREVFTDALRSQALAELAEQKSGKVLPDKFPTIIIPDPELPS